MMNVRACSASKARKLLTTESAENSREIAEKTNFVVNWLETLLRMRRRAFSPGITQKILDAVKTHLGKVVNFSATSWLHFSAISAVKSFAQGLALMAEG